MLSKIHFVPIIAHALYILIAHIYVSNNKTMHLIIIEIYIRMNVELLHSQACMIYVI